MCPQLQTKQRAMDACAQITFILSETPAHVMVLPTFTVIGIT